MYRNGKEAFIKDKQPCFPQRQTTHKKKYSMYLSQPFYILKMDGGWEGCARRCLSHGTNIRIYILKSALCNLHMALNIEMSIFLSYFISDD